MKNLAKMVGIIAFVAVITFTMAACGDEPDPQPQPGANANNPIDRVESTNLGTMTSSASGWQQLLYSINSTGKYINLDLSACTMTGTAFNPDSTVETGKKYIVSIVLPAVATSIEAGTSSNSTFKNFTNLKSINGANIITIGDYSFELDYLQSVDFPLVTTIGAYAFRFCSDLESISFPASAQLGYSSDNGSYSNPFSGCDNLTSFTLSGSGSLSVIENGKALVRNGTILLAYPSATGTVTMNNITALDGNVFQDCYDLDSVNFPQVTSIGSEAFYGCERLQSASFPLVTSIGSEAFYYCRNIQDVNFPQATSIGSEAFYGCERLQSASFPLVTTIGFEAFYFCSALVSVNIPKVTNIGGWAFSSTGAAALSITMGSIAPTLGDNIFGTASTAKTVTVEVPAGAVGYGPSAFGTNTTANWANGLRGGGWNGSSFAQYSQPNQNITVNIQRQ